MKLSILILTMLAFFSSGCVPMQCYAQEKIDAKALFEKKCSACHSTSRPKSLSKTKEEWTKSVTKCKEKKNSNISDEEAKIIIDYLAKTYGK